MLDTHYHIKGKRVSYVADFTIFFEEQGLQKVTYFQNQNQISSVTAFEQRYTLSFRIDLMHSFNYEFGH